jgi:hypothetical protein
MRPHTTFSVAFTTYYPSTLQLVGLVRVYAKKLKETTQFVWISIQTRQGGQSTRRYYEVSTVYYLGLSSTKFV